MTLQDLIRRFRVLSGDRAEPYMWSDEDVADWLNDAQQHACIRARLLREDSAGMCRIALEPGRQSYRLHPALYEIIHARIVPVAGQPRTLRLVSRELLDDEHPNWREDVRPAAMAVQDDTRLRVVGAIAEGDTLVLEAYRLPVSPMEQCHDEPEIHRAHHEHLLQWALHKAFSVVDGELFDPQRAERAALEFAAYFGLLPDAGLRRETRTDVLHHNRAILP